MFDAAGGNVNDPEIQKSTIGQFLTNRAVAWLGRWPRLGETLSSAPYQMDHQRYRRSRCPQRRDQHPCRRAVFHGPDVRMDLRVQVIRQMLDGRVEHLGGEDAS